MLLPGFLGHPAKKFFISLTKQGRTEEFSSTGNDYNKPETTWFPGYTFIHIHRKKYGSETLVRGLMGQHGWMTKLNIVLVQLYWEAEKCKPRMFFFVIRAVYCVLSAFSPLESKAETVHRFRYIFLCPSLTLLSELTRCLLTALAPISSSPGTNTLRSNALILHLLRHSCGNYAKKLKG